MRRREFIMPFGGAAATWPLAARAQSQQRVRLIGVLAGATENDPQAQRRVGAFTQALRDLGWSDGANIKLEKRYSAGIPGRLPALATELVQANCAVTMLATRWVQVTWPPWHIQAGILQGKPSSRLIRRPSDWS